MNKEEQNYQTLRSAIQQLPHYEPSTAVWEGIDQRLKSEETLDNALAQLTTYAPPTAVWERISADLEKPATVRRLRPVWIGIAAAAVVVVSVGTYFWNTQTPEPVETLQVVYQEVEQPSNVVKADWDDDEADIDFVAKAYAQRVAFLQKDNSLLSELEELNQAKLEIKTMLAKYGNDANLIRTIADIERQRSAIVKQMATEI